MPFDATTRAFLRKAVSADTSNLAWGSQRLQSYLRQLKRETGAKDIDWGRAKQLLCEDAVGWIADFDPNLRLFSTYHRDFELGRAKATGIFKMPSEIRQGEAAIRARLGKVAYDVRRSLAEQPSEVAILEVFSGTGRLTCTIAENTVSRVKVPLPTGAIGGLVPEVERWANANVPGFTELMRLMVDAVVVARTVTTVRLLFDEALVEVATDTFRVGKGGEQEVTDYQKRFRGGLTAAYKSVPEPDVIVDKTVSEPLITASLAEKFRKLKRSDLIVAPETIKLGGGTSRERITNEIGSQVESEIASEIARHYRWKKDLSDFFAENTKYDPDRVAEGHRALKGIAGFSESGGTSILFYVRPVTGADSERAKLRIDNSIVDSIRVVIDPTHGLVRGSSKENTTEQLDVVLTEIRNLLPPRL